MILASCFGCTNGIAGLLSHAGFLLRRSWLVKLPVAVLGMPMPPNAGAAKIKLFIHRQNCFHFEAEQCSSVLPCAASTRVIEAVTHWPYAIFGWPCLASMASIFVYSLYTVCIQLRQAELVGAISWDNLLTKLSGRNRRTSPAWKAT